MLRSCDKNKEKDKEIDANQKIGACSSIDSEINDESESANKALNGHRINSICILCFSTRSRRFLENCNKIFR